MSARHTIKADAGQAAQTESSKGRILIVEDHVDARLVMEEFLEAKGFSTTLAKVVDEAVALLEGGIPFDLVILDLMLPGKGGLELLSTLREKAGDRGKLPVIVVSAFAPPEIDEVDAVLHKPVELAELLATVQRLLGRP